MRKDIDKLSPEVRSIIRAQVTRRSLLVGAGAIAGIVIAVIVVVVIFCVWKREKVAEISVDVGRRVSQKIRSSFKGKP
jgi:hypothetical protein